MFIYQMVSLELLYDLFHVICYMTYAHTGSHNISDRSVHVVIVREKDLPKYKFLNKSSLRYCSA